MTRAPAPYSEPAFHILVRVIVLKLSEPPFEHLEALI
jgi:hypothetical protein